MFKEIACDTDKPFCITIGLIEGYGDGKVHTSTDMEDLIESWMKGRIEKELPYLTGTVISGNLVYAWSNTATGPQSNREPSAMFVGNVNPIYNKDLSDEEIVEILKDLAFFLGEKLYQTRVYMTYRGQIYVFQDSKKTHPTQ